MALVISFFSTHTLANSCNNSQRSNYALFEHCAESQRAETQRAEVGPVSDAIKESPTRHFFTVSNVKVIKQRESFTLSYM